MKHSPLTLLLFSLISVAVPSAFAESHKFPVAVTEIKNVLEENVDLAYSYILDSLNDKLGHKMEYLFAPSPRTARMLKQRNALCLFPGSLQSPVNGIDEMIESTPIHTATAHFVSGNGVTLDGASKEEGKKLLLAYRSGNTFGGKIETLRRHTLVPVNTSMQLLGMLQKKRVDAILVYSPDILPLLRTEKFVGLLDKPILAYPVFHSQNDSFLCHKTPETQHLVGLINAAIEELRSEGRLQLTF